MLFLTLLLNAGTDSLSLSWEARQVRLTNATALFALAMILVYDLLYIAVAPSVLAAILTVTVTFAVLYGFVVWLNFRGMNHAAKVLHCSATLGILVVSSVFGVGPGAGIQYYFLVFLALPPMLWSSKQWFWVALFVAATLAASLYLDLVPPRSLLQGAFPTELSPWLRYPALIASGLTIAAVVVVSQVQVERREKMLVGQTAAVQEQNLWKDRLFGIVAHDLRSPFSGLQKSLEVLTSEYDQLTDNERKQWLQSLSESSSQTARLVDGLLDWARDLMLSAVPRFVPFDLGDAVRQELVGLTSSADAKRIRLVWQGPVVILANADPQMTRTIVRNLVSNAVKFTPDGGAVTVSVEAEGGRWRVAVQDTGVGIESHRLSSMFEFQGRQTTHGTRQETGTGLGLILCRDFARKNGGDLAVESVPGKGSRFSFDVAAAPT